MIKCKCHEVQSCRLELPPPKKKPSRIFTDIFYTYIFTHNTYVHAYITMHTHTYIPTYIQIHAYIHTHAQK